MLIIKIQNDGTGTVEHGNYRYQVLINRDVIEGGAVVGHKRKLGWRNLVSMVLDESRRQEAVALCDPLAAEIAKAGQC